MDSQIARSFPREHGILAATHKGVANATGGVSICGKAEVLPMLHHPPARVEIEI